MQGLGSTLHIQKKLKFKINGDHYNVGDPRSEGHKLNFDGVINKATKIGGIGVIIRNGSICRQHYRYSVSFHSES